MAPLALLEITSDENVSKIGSYLGQKGPRLSETPSERVQISWMLYQTQKDLKIYNLKTANDTLMIHQNYVPPTP